MVWEGTGVNGKTNLHIVDNSTLTTESYCCEILYVHVRPYAGAVVPDFILMQDNAHSNTACLTNQYIAHETNKLLP